MNSRDYGFQGKQSEMKTLHSRIDRQETTNESQIILEFQTTCEAMICWHHIYYFSLKTTAGSSRAINRNNKFVASSNPYICLISD